MKKLRLIGIMGYHINVQPLELLEGDVVRENLHLMKRNKFIDSEKFVVWDKRVRDSQDG